MESERLARMEEKLDWIKDLFSRSLEAQEKHNETFYKAEKRVTILETAGRTAWKVLAILGTVSAGLGATFAFIVEHPPSYFFAAPITSTEQVTHSATPKSPSSLPLPDVSPIPASPGP